MMLCVQVQWELHTFKLFINYVKPGLTMILRTEGLTWFNNEQFGQAIVRSAPIVCLQNEYQLLMVLRGVKILA